MDGTALIQFGGGKSGGTGAVASVNGRAGAIVLAKGDVGLGDVDNTADSAKPVSTAQAAALALKADTLTADTTATIGVSGKASVPLSAVACTDEGSGLVGFAVPSHTFTPGDVLRLPSSTLTNYNSVDLTVDAATTTTKVVVSGAAYAAETMVATQFLLYKQPATAAQIQALIDAVPKNLNGKTLIFQFQDGLYNLSTGLTFTFFSNGILRIYGKAVDNTTGENKRVVLVSGSTAAVIVSYGSAVVMVRYLKTRIAVGSTTAAAISFVAVPHGCSIQYCSTVCDSDGAGIAVAASPAVLLSYNFFSGGTYGVSATATSELASNYGLSSPILPPAYGLRSDASTIYKYNTTQPTGSTQAELKANGGQIY